MNGTDILITAVEGGIGYWAKVHEYEPDRARAFAVITDAEDPDNPTAYTITATGQNSAAGFVYTIDNTGTERTNGVPAAWGSVPAAGYGCWVTKRGETC